MWQCPTDLAKKKKKSKTEEYCHISLVIEW